MKKILYVGLAFMGFLSQSGLVNAASHLNSIGETVQDMRIMEQANAYLKFRPNLVKEVLINQDSLIRDKNSPSYGPTDAKVTIVVFFDYQCIYCSHMAKDLENLRQNNPQVRIVFKEWPIFKNRWGNSLLAARTGLSIWKKLGADAYHVWHDSLFATGHSEGMLTVDDIHKASKIVGYSSVNLTNVEDELQKTEELARQLGFTGTPAVIIMPTKGVNADNMTVIPGYVNPGVIKASVSKAMIKNNLVDL